MTCAPDFFFCNAYFHVTFIYIAQLYRCSLYLLRIVKFIDSLGRIFFILTEKLIFVGAHNI